MASPTSSQAETATELPRSASPKAPNSEQATDVLPPQSPTARRRLKDAVLRCLRFVVGQWFLIGMGAVIAFAYAWPNVARTDGILKSQYTIKYLLVAIIFFLSGLSLPLKNLYLRAADWRLHLVTQLANFLLFPTIVFAIISCVKASDPTYRTFDKFALLGMLVMGVVPTTVSSNVVMTGQAGGSQSAATIEVMLGNLLGTFLSPALLQMFCSAKGWEFGTPQPSGPGGTSEIYREVIKQLGFSVFIPLFAGEVIQYIWPKQVKYAMDRFKVGKVGSICLLGVLWSNFSSAFYSHAFESLSGSDVTFVLLGNIFIFILMSFILFAIARMVPIPNCHLKKDITDENDEIERNRLFDPSTTIALMFCGPAKGVALGAPIVQIMYGGLSARDTAVVTLPLVLYQGSQVALGQLEVAVLKAWMKRMKKRRADTEAAEKPMDRVDTAVVEQQ